ncbi:ABC transporter substrate-binding protein [Robinsoniella sp. KNHs210]|uniref:ABC transporter substrate-binding protein n=1 Tax=Robinsoniella sp. KNHs210 TaxID=1469950 RepID=UPI00047F172B|nr:ABC transporter substrate-binding protein [Robinsoniella sp. KNHs210]
MKSKKVIALGMAALMGASLFAGCGDAAKVTESTSKETKQETKKEEGTSSSTEGTAGELEPVELIWNLVGTPQDDQETVFTEVNKILKEKLNTTIKFNIIDWGSYDEKMKVSIATNEPFDLCFTSDWTNPYITNAQKGAFYPINDLLDQYGQHIKEQVPESYWDATKVGDEIFGVINYQVTARIKGVSFPKDVVDEIGYDVNNIKSYTDLDSYFAAVQEKKPDMVPFLGMGETTEMPALLTDDTGYAIAYLQGPLAVRKEDPGKTFNAVESQEFMDFCKMTREWYEKGYVRKDLASITDFKGEAKTHQYGAFTTGVGPGSAEVETANAGFPVVQAQTIPSHVSTGSIQAALTAISVNCQNPERAMMVLDYLFTDKDTYNMLCYGIEGKHYNAVNDYSIEVIEGGGYNPGIAWEFGSWFNAKLLKGQPEDLWDQMKEINATALTSPILGFVYDAGNVKNESAQITALMTEYLPGLMSGSVNPEEKIPELIDKMNAAGMDKIQKDADEQLAAWKK